MLTMAQVNVQPDLKQKLELLPETIAPLPLDRFTEKNAAEPTVKFLYFPTGIYSGHHVLYNENELILKNCEQSIKFAFPVGSEIVDVDVLQTKDKQFGLVVLVNDKDETYLTRLVKRDNQLKTVHESLITHPGVCVKVVVDDADMPACISAFTKPMAKWTNIVVVGTRNAHAYVLYVPVEKDWPVGSRPLERNLTDALTSFHIEKDRTGKSTKFLYKLNIDGRSDVIKHVEDVYVTSIAYIPRSCDLLIGLSFGGIVQCGFTPHGDIATNIFQCSAPVRHIVPMLPHDDPNMNVWFWAFHGEQGKGLVMVLYEGSYRVIGQENAPIRGREFRKPTFFPRLFDQVASKGTTAEWITCRALIRERKIENSEEDRTEDSAIQQNATLNDTDVDASQMFYSYRDSNGNLKFGLFDLNTYYYKRLPDKPLPDATIAKQCPYLTNIFGPPQKAIAPLGAIMDILVDCSSISRFSFITDDPEQQNYISGLEVKKIHIEGTKANAVMRLQSLPLQVLHQIYGNLEAYIKNPRDAATKLVAVGLMPAPLELDSGRHGGEAMMHSAMLYGITSFEILMTAAVYYGFSSEIVKTIIATKNTEWSTLRVKCEWLWTEVQRAKSKLDALEENLFCDTAKALSAEQNRHLKQIYLVLNSAKTVYRAVLDKFKEWEHVELVPRDVVLENECRLSAVSNLSDFGNCLRNLYKAKYLPLGERNAEERRILERVVQMRRKALSALPEAKPLFVDGLISKMQDISPNEAFWLEQSPDQWYPPALMNGVAVLLVIHFQQRLKQEFLIYYMIDIVMAKKNAPPLNNEVAITEVKWIVTELLKGVAKIRADDVANVLNIWCEEQSQYSLQRQPEDSIGNSTSILEELNMKINALTNKHALTVDEEKQLKELCSKMPGGQFRFQLYLIERSRFSEVEILSVPLKPNNIYTEMYSQILPAIRRIKQNLLQFKKAQVGHKWSDDLLAKIRNFVPSKEYISDDGPKSKLLKTPIPLRKQLRMLPKENENMKEEIPIPEATTPDKGQESSLDGTPKIEELDEKTRQKITNLLRTPTSRRARAAAAAEGQTGVELTPECQPITLAPTSILKTPIRRDTVMSPGRGRLRWDPDFVEPSLDSSQLSTNDYIVKPVEFRFSSEESVSVEEQSEEGSNRDDNDETMDIGDQQDDSVQTDKSTVEIQDDNDINEKELIAEEDYAEQIKLVDYSVSDSTFTATPPRTICHNDTRSNKWIDADGIEHSFELQQEYEDEIEKGEGESVELVNEATIEPAESTFVKSNDFAQEVIQPIEARQPTVEKHDKQKEEEQREAHIDVDKYKRKTQILSGKPPRAQKMMSEEPDITKPRRLRRSLSESADIPEPEEEVPTRRSTRRSISRVENKPSTAHRALFVEKQEEPKSPSRRSSVRRAAVSVSEPIIEEAKSPSRRTRTPSARRRKSPSAEAFPESSDTLRKNVRASSIRKEPTPVTETAPETLNTPRRSTRTPSARKEPTPAPEAPHVQKSPARRGRTPSIKVEPTVEPKSPSRRGRTKTPSESTNTETQTPAKRGRPRKDNSQGQDAVENFRTLLNQARRTGVKRSTSDKETGPTIKKANVPETIEEVEEQPTNVRSTRRERRRSVSESAATTTVATRSSSRSRQKSKDPIGETNTSTPTRRRGAH